STKYQIRFAVSDETTVEGYGNNTNGDSSSSRTMCSRSVLFYIEFYCKITSFV
ncbi:unnamed protein product, partial [Brassica oleracea var. botrytis]